MVKGLKQFAEYFSEFSEEYVIIGGTACALLLEGQRMIFRQTKDIDVVLTISSEKKEFARALWQYITDHGYRYVNHATGKPQFYRFKEPDDQESPWMIELFSKAPSEIEHVSGYLTPLPMGEDVSSLSAILLDDEYYELILQGRKIVEGVPILDAPYLMMLKASAWYDLNERKMQGQSVDSSDIKKHKTDIFRLFGILPQGKSYSFPERIREDFNRFLDWMALHPTSMNMKMVQMPGREVLDVVNEMREAFNPK